MLTEATFETRDRITEFVPSESVDVSGAIFAETRWREPKQRPCTVGAGSDITLSRWTATGGKERTECATTPDDCHVVALALGATSMQLWTSSKPLFEGSVPPGTILVSAPGQQLRVRVTPPFDFLHLHVGNRFLRDEGLAPDEDGIAAPDESAPFRDTLAEALGRSLLDENLHRSQPEYARVVAKAIVMRAIGRPPAKRRCLALPKWRMKRVEQYLAVNIDKRVSLDDMAAAAGLSKMHFAAQFRTATGFRPHEYLLFKRIERAKAVLAATEMPLVQVAFSVGFVAQAHFSTVFKRFTGKSPARWKQEPPARGLMPPSRPALGPRSVLPKRSVRATPEEHVSRFLLAVIRNCGVAIAISIFFAAARGPSHPPRPGGVDTSVAAEAKFPDSAAPTR